MPTSTINLTAYETSDPISVDPTVPVGIDTDKPVAIETADGSRLAPVTKNRHALIVIPPTDTIVIKALDQAATVKVTTA